MFDQSYLDLLLRIWLMFSKGVIIPIAVPILISSIVSLVRNSSFYNKKTDFVILALFSIFGGLVGFFTGASREPVVGTVLPVIISTVVTYIGYLASKQLNEEQKKLVPFCVIVFLLATWIATLYGMSLRLDWSIM